MAVLLINKTEDETRFALMRGDSLCEYSVERTDREEIIGNIYLARVERVDERHNACFVDFGSDRDGFCTFGDLPVPFDSGKPRIRRGDTIIIQVEREAVGSKGASVTGYVSLAGQYVVLTPDTETAGISRKVPDA
ncbi:MAG: ribonuclease E/G, partial [Myxococcales bacterium]|nr:ribonuclease E/G [Myxococcales bacterium]